MCNPDATLTAKTMSRKEMDKLTPEQVEFLLTKKQQELTILRRRQAWPWVAAFADKADYVGKSVRSFVVSQVTILKSLPMSAWLVPTTVIVRAAPHHRAAAALHARSRATRRPPPPPPDSLPCATPQVAAPGNLERDPWMTFLSFVCLAMVLLAGKKMVDKFENTEWRKDLRAVAAKNTEEYEKLKTEAKDRVEKRRAKAKKVE